MSRSYRLLLLICLFTLTAVCAHSGLKPSDADNQNFQQLLATVPEDAIHAALHQLPEFKDGVFSKDRTAIEAVHSENARLATQLVQLAKRQVSNTTTTRTGTSTTANESTTSARTTTPTETTSDIRTSVIAPSATDATPVSTQSSGGAVIFSSSNGGLQTISSSTALVSFRPSTTTILTTTTLPGGQRSTITSITVVAAPATTFATEGVAAVSASESAAASLQTGGSNSQVGYAKEFMAVFGGAVAVALVL